MKKFLILAALVLAGMLPNTSFAAICYSQLGDPIVCPTGTTPTTYDPTSPTGATYVASPPPALTNGGRLQYTPLEPLPLTKAGPYNGTLSQYLNIVFNILLSIGAMIAIVTLVIGGITYMISESIGTKSDAKRRIQAALIGLFLLLTCWLILNEINPDLTKFKLLGIDNSSAAPASTAAPAGTTFGASNAPSSGDSINQNSVQNCETGLGGVPTGKHVVYNDASGPSCQ